MRKGIGFKKLFTVKTLKEELEKYPDDMEVQVYCHDFYQNANSTWYTTDERLGKTYVAIGIEV
jgi:hypothetical protein